MAHESLGSLNFCKNVKLEKQIEIYKIQQLEMKVVDS